MGCQNSKDADRYFYDHYQYTPSDVIGNGANGVVYRCVKLIKNQPSPQAGDFAVKMVLAGDKTSPSLLEEIAIMKDLDNSHVIRLVDWFKDQTFHYIVMDLFADDLVHAMLRKKTAGGKLDIRKPQIVRAVKQMLYGIEYIHQKHIIHCDIKADNFLLTVPDFIDENCRIVLTDFGYAVRLKPGQYRMRPVGTPKYWAPEVIRKKYDHQADIWSLGVIVYALFTGRFPFNELEEILYKQVDLQHVPKDARQFVGQLLTKSSVHRLTASDALAHDWLILKSKRNPDMPGVVPSDQGGDGEDFVIPASVSTAAFELMQQNREMATEQEQKRRQNALNKIYDSTRDRIDMVFPKGTGFNKTNSLPDNRSATIGQRGPFWGTNEYGKQVAYEWWEMDKVKAHQIRIPYGMMTTTIESAGRERQAKDQITIVPWTQSALERYLQNNGVDISLFGQGEAKTISDLAKELARGETQFMIDDENALVRLVESVFIKIVIKTQEGEFRRELAPRVEETFAFVVEGMKDHNVLLQQTKNPRTMDFPGFKKETYPGLPIKYSVDVYECQVKVGTSMLGAKAKGVGGNVKTGIGKANTGNFNNTDLPRSYSQES